MDNPLLSIILVTKNSVGLLKEFLDNFSRLEFLEICELIVVDGLSSDGTYALLDGNRDIVSIFISESDLGIYDGMRKGVSLANGKWLLFMGADDRFHSEKFLISIYSNVNNIPSNIDLLIGFSSRSGKILKNYLNFRLLFGNCLNHQSVLYNKALFEYYEYDLSYKLAADYKFNLQCLIGRKRCCYLNFPFVKYGEFGASSTNLELGKLEMDRVRTQVLGHFGYYLNQFIRLKRFIFRSLFEKY